MLRRILFALFITSALAGCATPKIEWSKPGVTKAEFDRDRYECERDTRTAMQSFATRADLVDFAKRCMESKGYTGHQTN